MTNPKRLSIPPRGGQAFALFLALALLVAAPAAARTTRVLVELEPRVIGLGDQAELSITVEGDGEDVPSVPAIDGLRFEYAGQSSRLESIQGRVRIARTFHVRVRPERQGTFRFDPEAFAVGDVAARGEPLLLEVQATSPSTQAPSVRRGRTPLGPTEEDVAGAPEEPFLRIAAEHERPFVGELVPIRIEAWFPEGMRASIGSEPRSVDTAFTLETPEQDGDVQRRLHEGRVYNVLTWHAALVGVKEGPHALDIEVDATLQVPDRRPRRGARRGFGSSLLDDDFFGGSSLAARLLDDPFFNDPLLDSFFGRTVEKEVTLRATLDDFEVRGLPAEGRPASFRGAVGSFELSLGRTPSRATTGDPIQVETTVSGRGHFARVQAPIVEDGPAWKSYEPEASFEAADELGALGRKRFTHTLVPRDPATLTVPSFTFAYFDPLEERYEVLTTESRPIAVEGPARTAEPTPAAPGSSVPSAPVSVRVPVPDADALATYVPRPWQPRFRVLVAGALALLALGLGLSIARRRRERDPGRHARREAGRAVAAARGDLDQALRAADAPAFFDAARRLLQQRLALEWGVEPASITAADVRSRHPAAAPIAEILEAADQVAFGAEPIDGTSLTLWKERVAHALDAMEVK